MTAPEYQSLAEFRYLIRRYLTNAEQDARSAGLEPQQYQLLLALRGLPPGREPSIQTLAERLQVRHHSAVELADRLEEHGLIRRQRSKTDRRHVLLSLTQRGERVLARLASRRIADLRNTAPALVRALSDVIASAQESAVSRHARGKSGA
ncbi:MAG TPA: MarR family transcriptional regulator [Methylomirabilota bacterium]|nr:MarR family transcriptional regulator [Methylomirabilota bacterium]